MKRLLSPFGVAGAWENPVFDLLPLSPANSVAHLRDWDATADAAAAVQKISAYVGAFPLLPNSRDAVAVESVWPGAYTIMCAAGPGGAGGEVLIEVYVLP